MSDQGAPRRGWIPSPREAGSVVPSGQAGPPVVRKEERIGFRGRVREAARAVDPRGISAGGKIFPLVALSLLATVGQLDDMAFILLLPVIKLDFGFDFQFMLTLQALVGVVTTLLAPVAGYLADRVRRVMMVRIGAFLGNGAAVLTGLAPTPGALAGIRVIGGFGPGIEQPAKLPLLTDYYPPDTRVRMFTFFQMVRAVGPAIALAVVAVAVWQFGVSWRAVMVGTGTASLAISMLTLRLREPRRGELERRAMGRDEESAKREQSPPGWGEAWRTLSSIGSLRRLWYATPFLTVAQQGLVAFLFFVLLERQARGDLAGPGAGLLAGPQGMLMFVALPPILAIVGLAFAAPIADRLMRYRPGRILVFVGVALALQAAAMMSVVFLPWILVAFLMVFAASAIGAMILPAQFTLLAAVVPARVRGQGIQSIAPWQLLGFLILPVTGAFADAYGVIPGAMALGVVFGIGAVITGTAGTNVKRDMRAALAASMAEEDAVAARLRGGNKMLICRDVDAAYDGTQVLFGVDLDVEEGELVALLGTNGAGKSTLLKAIFGIRQASNGAVFFDGQDITHRPPHLNARDGIVFLPGGRAIFESLTVVENLRAATWLGHDGQAPSTRDYEEVLDFFPVLRDRFDQQAGSLSGGEQQMLALAQSFLMRPRLLMIDELSLGLAPKIVERLLDIVRTINARGTTVILVEQSVNVSLTVADRAVFMDRGEIRFDGPTTELLARPDLLRAVFLGGAVGPGLIRGVREESEGDAEIRVSVEGLRVRYGGVHALDGVTVEGRAGEVVGVVGPNGAGKTTLFDVITGFVRPEVGIVRLDGVDCTDLSPDARARLGLVRSFQNTDLFRSLTVVEAIAVALERKVQNQTAAAAALWLPAVRQGELRVSRRVEYLIDVLGLASFADKFVSEVSTGTRRMVELACIMAAEPRTLLLDEPTSGLAQSEIEVLGPVIRRLALEAGAAIIVIEHDMPFVSAISDRIVAMDLGQIIAEGQPDTVLNDPRVVRSYLGASESVVNRSGALRRAIRHLEGAYETARDDQREGVKADG